MKDSISLRCACKKVKTTQRQTSKASALDDMEHTIMNKRYFFEYNKSNIGSINEIDSCVCKG